MIEISSVRRAQLALAQDIIRIYKLKKYTPIITVHADPYMMAIAIKSLKEANLLNHKKIKEILPLLQESSKPLDLAISISSLCGQKLKSGSNMLDSEYGLFFIQNLKVHPQPSLLLVAWKRMDDQGLWPYLHDITSHNNSLSMVEGLLALHHSNSFPKEMIPRIHQSLTRSAEPFMLIEVLNSINVYLILRDTSLTLNDLCDVFDVPTKLLPSLLNEGLASLREAKLLQYDNAKYNLNQLPKLSAAQIKLLNIMSLSHLITVENFEVLLQYLSPLTYDQEIQTMWLVNCSKVTPVILTELFAICETNQSSPAFACEQVKSYFTEKLMSPVDNFLSRLGFFRQLSNDQEARISLSTANNG